MVRYYHCITILICDPLNKDEFILLITRYRDMAMQPECEQAIEDIVTDAIVQEDNEPAVQINMDRVQAPDSIKNEFRIAFDEVLRLLNFNEDGTEIFKRWVS